MYRARSCCALHEVLDGGTQTLTGRGLRLLKGQGQRAKAKRSEHAPPLCACAYTGRRGVPPPLQNPGSAPEPITLIFLTVCTQMDDADSTSPIYTAR